MSQLKVPLSVMGMLAFLCGIFSLTSLAFSQEIIEIDKNEDIPSNGHWKFDCYLGYATTPSDFICDLAGVDFPSEDLNGEIGFWTKCRTTCDIIYKVQPSDTRISFRLYQLSLTAEISLDDAIHIIITGENWVEYSHILTNSGIQELRLRLDYFASQYYTLLDKIILNGEFMTTTTDIPSENPSSTQCTTLEPTTDPASSDTTDPTSSESTDPTSSDSTDATSSDTTDPTSSVSTDPTSSDTTDPTSSDSTDPTSSYTNKPTSLTSNYPTTTVSGSTSTFKSTSTGPTSNTPLSSSPTFQSSSAISTSEETWGTSETSTLGPSFTPTYLPTSDYSGNSESGFITSTESSTKKYGFISNIWSVFLISILGSIIFVLALIYCIRHLLIRRRYKRDKEDDRVNILPSKSPSVQRANKIYEPYAFLGHYNYQPNEILPSGPQHTSFAVSPRAKYRESTPYLILKQEPNRKFVPILPKEPPTRIQNEPYFPPSQNDHPSPSRHPTALTLT